jgi:hypothetical protein
MSIWFNKSLKLADLEMTGAGTMSEFLEMQFVELGDEYIKMKMPCGPSYQTTLWSAAWRRQLCLS